VQWLGDGDSPHTNLLERDDLARALVLGHKHLPVRALADLVQILKVLQPASRAALQWSKASQLDGAYSGYACMVAKRWANPDSVWMARHALRRIPRPPATSVALPGSGSCPAHAWVARERNRRGEHTCTSTERAPHATGAGDVIVGRPCGNARVAGAWEKTHNTSNSTPI
jgi:hypothetical protein